MQGWQGKLLSRGGRLLLQNSVLASIPLYHMMCFVLPKWVINRIDAIRRRFLWGKSDDSGKGISLINWDLVCTPRQWGGLGAVNLEFRNLSLVMRWWWKIQTEPEGLWAYTAITLRAVQMQTDGPLVWTAKGSFFWHQLLKWKHIYHWSVTVKVGQGTMISFWYDTWGKRPLRDLKDGLPRPRLQSISLRDAWALIPELAPQLSQIQMVFGTQEDEFRWRWNSSGSYSASSLYQTIMAVGRIGWEFAFTWKASSPLKVKIFTLLMLKERILTQDTMARRGIPCEMQCFMCRSGQVESVLHLFFECSNTTLVWGEVQRLMGRNLIVLEATIQDTWEASWDKVRREGGMNRTEWTTTCMCVTWNLWKQRNETVFREKTKPPAILVKHILDELVLWKRCCRGSANREGIG